ncbi:RICIN domain-containing protein [Streptomyces abikoensis]|uniref:RICIN domain-containing protein n=1 Tax=Streptomyces abikoensis TaxID=97398 RepID=UPI0033D3DAB8
MKKIAKFAGIAMSAVAAVALFPGTSVAAPNFPTKLVDNWNWKCLEVENSSSSNGAKVQMWSCGEQAGAKWKFVPSGNGYYIVNANSGKCLEIADSRTDNGAPAQQWDCVGIDTQRWYLADSMIINGNSRKVLEVNNGSSDNGARVQQWDNSNLKWQRWSYGN